MVIVLWILYVLILIFLLVVLGVRPQIPSHSRFELQRRARQGDEEAVYVLRKKELMRDIFSLQRVVVAILLVSLSIIGVELFNLLFGFFTSLVVALESGAVARVSVLQGRSQALYDKYEGRILKFIENNPFIFKMIRSVAPVSSDNCNIESKEELISIVEQSGEVLTNNDRNMILNSLKFDHVTVESAMTPRSMVDYIKKEEMLGPLVLSSLHKTGHSRFPVIDSDIDHVVGMLYIQDLLKIDHKTKSYKAESVMEKKVYYIRQDQDLRSALSAFIRTRHHLFVVVNEFRETVGLLALEDVIERLLGRKIVDEFDAYEDLRKVAESNPRKNNQPHKKEEI